MVKSTGPSGEGKHSSPRWGGSQGTTSALSLLMHHLFGQWELFGVVTFGGVFHPLAVEQGAGQDRQGAQLLRLLMNFRNNHSPLPLSKQTQGEVRRCKYNIQCNGAIPWLRQTPCRHQ